ncbi:MAG: DUF6106 family protein [Lachnospiraceae bacterium]|nr:DUF6106 family protein [Lachnospiraceae bacterium]
MNDTYVEVMVDRKKSPLLGAGRVVLYAAAAVFLLMGLVSSVIFIIVAVLLAVAAYFVIPMFDLEYEYLYIDREISIDKIMSKEKRKHAYTVDLNKMDIIAPVNSHELDSYKARNVRTYDFSSGYDDRRVYSIVYEAGSEGTVLVNIEPNEEMLRAIKNVFPRKVLEC